MQQIETTQQAVPLWQRLLIGRKPKRTLLRAAILGICVFFVFRFVLIGIRIVGLSMEPTYHDGRVNVVNRLSYKFGKPKRGDVVGIRQADLPPMARPQIMYLKRIIGLPGEVIEIHKGIVFINGEDLQEPYVRYRYPWEEPPRKLGPNDYFLIGDNRGMPQELHAYGTAYADQLVGKVLW